MYNENIEVIKEVEFKEINVKTPFYDRKSLLPDREKLEMKGVGEKVKALEKESEGQEVKGKEIKGKEVKGKEAFEQARDSIKEIQEKAKEIERTSLCIKLVRDEGLTRAHITHRITHQLLAVIPWYMDRVEGDSEGKETVGINMGKENRSPLSDYFVSFYANMSRGVQVDKEI